MKKFVLVESFTRDKQTKSIIALVAALAALLDAVDSRESAVEWMKGMATLAKVTGWQGEPIDLPVHQLKNII